MKTIALRPKDDLHDKIKAAAEARQLSMAAWCLQAAIDKLPTNKEAKNPVGRPPKGALEREIKARILGVFKGRELEALPVGLSPSAIARKTGVTGDEAVECSETWYKTTNDPVKLVDMICMEMRRQGQLDWNAEIGRDRLYWLAGSCG